MTLGAFADVFAMLAKQLRATDADQADIESYYKVLRDIEIEFIQMAAERFSQTAEWFPKTSEWRRMARLIEHERTTLQRAIIQNLPERLCLGCDDTGWAWDPATNCVSRCRCATLRRLEVLGRRPMPRLVERSEVPLDPALLETVRDRLKAMS